MELKWGPWWWSGRGGLWLQDTGLGSWCGQTVPGWVRVWGRGLTGSCFLPAGAWVQVSPSPELWEGQAVVLTCQVPAGVLEGTSYLWYQDGQPLLESNSATLRFTAITLSQAGAYHCQAQTPGSATMSLAAPVSLHVSCKLSSCPCFLGGEGSKGIAGGGAGGALVPGTASTREHQMRGRGP